MITVEPKSGNIGLIKAPHSAKATGVTLYSSEFEPVYNNIKEINSLVSAAMTGKFDYQWEYDQQAEAYCLVISYYQGKYEFAVKFAKERAGQILQNLVEKEQHVMTLVLKYKEGAHGYFEDSVVLMGIELEILPEADWPSKS
jgi:hypothetical protein